MIITRIYKENEGKPVIMKRALALKAALEELEIKVRPEELIVGNRSAGSRAGIVFPESGSAWVDIEFETLPTRPQDKFLVREEDIDIFRKEIKPYWEGKSLEDEIEKRYGNEIGQMKKIVKINQTDHAQGHICPDCAHWLEKGPTGLLKEAKIKLLDSQGERAWFYESVILVMEGVKNFMMRYHEKIRSMLDNEDTEYRADLELTADICKSISERPPESFHEVVQSLWFLFVVLHMESNASSFSPGRMDRYLAPYYEKDIASGKLNRQRALEIIESLWIKFNEIVYMRSENSARYFAGFPIGFNIAIGGMDARGKDFYNDLSLLFLKA